MGTSARRVSIKKNPSLKEIYHILFHFFGPQHWWPAQTPFEVVVGAILVQNTNWANTEKAIKSLKKARMLTPIKLKTCSVKQLASLIKSAGYFNIKAKRLKNFIHFLFGEYQGSLRKMAQEKTETLRRRLLSVNGIGEETADSILLYAFHKPVFVVDAYTRRIFLRHKFFKKDCDYQEIQGLFQKNLKSGARLFNEYHALIVRLGKDFCRSKPACDQCPLTHFQKEVRL